MDNDQIQSYAVMYFGLPPKPFANSSYDYQFKSMDWSLEEIEKGPDVAGIDFYDAYANVLYPYSSIWGPTQEKKNVSVRLQRLKYLTEFVYIGIDQRGGKIYFHKEVQGG